MQQRKIIIAGGGPAGLMAAGQAAILGADTVLLEKMNRVGIKLSITGKGRCNITNITELSNFISHFGKSGRFLHQAFSRFFNTDLIDFFDKFGVKVVRERGGRVFPESGKAQDIQRVLLQWNKSSKVRIECFSPVDKILIDNGHVIAVVSKGKVIPCDALILATGGSSYPATGSSGDGYTLSKSVGHTIIPVRQALVPLEILGDETKRLDKLNLRNVNVSMFVNGKKKKEEFGEIIFTSFGVSGPTILSLSGEVVDSIRQGKEISLSLDLKPALDDKKLDARLLRDIVSLGKEQVDSLIRGLIPGQMIPVCLELTHIPVDRRVCDISSKERMNLRNWLKDFRLVVKGFRPFSEAIITAGGVDTLEIDPKTMESRKIKGLFFAGELIDIQADTGGYNLQAAFSTGWIAGRSAVQQKY